VQVLLVESNPNLRWLFAQVLAGDGHVVTCVPTCDAALEACATAGWDVVVVDRSRPGADERPQLPGLGTHAPVLLISSDRAGTQPSGVTATLSKPFGADDFVGAVRRAGTLPHPV
jgi:CheY-like chemotaxis protein